jgi:hypothetical protein
MLKPSAGMKFDANPLKLKDPLGLKDKMVEDKIFYRGINIK